jgi:glycosyltransferase involved in cell wall biosynthesis
VFIPSGRHRQPEGHDGSFKLIYHGTLAHRYGIDLIIQAVFQVRESIPEISLTIHGAGEFLPDLIGLSEALGMGKYVQFSTKLVPMDKLPGLLEDADVGIVPYRRDVFTDGILPTKMMEYMALNMPVIAARTPIIEAYWDESMAEFFTPEVVEDLAGSILHLYRDRDRLFELIRNTEKFNRRYHWSRISEDYLTTIGQLIETDRPAAMRTRIR